jgi:hypothetical protein
MHFTPSEARAEVLACTRSGWSIDRIEAELIDAVPLDEEARHALWLYAWSLTGPVASTWLKPRRVALSA